MLLLVYEDGTLATLKHTCSLRCVLDVFENKRPADWDSQESR